ncbi:MAG: tetratricopeptide repeat protein [Thermodesulfobacteriota bacterium]
MIEANLEKMEELKDGLDQARTAGDLSAQAAMLYEIARLYHKEKIEDAARDYWIECRDLCRRAGLIQETAQVMIDLGDLARDRDDFDQAEESYRSAQAIYQETGDLKGRARISERLGDLISRKGDHEQALVFFREGLDLCREHDDPIGCLFFLDQMMPLLRAGDKVSELEQAGRLTITLAEKMGDRERMALGLARLADLYIKTGRIKEAEAGLVLAHDLYLHLGRDKEAGLIRAELDRLDLDSVKSLSP